MDFYVDFQLGLMVNCILGCDTDTLWVRLVRYLRENLSCFDWSYISLSVIFHKKLCNLGLVMEEETFKGDLEDQLSKY
jgi:hypothetical protein